MAITVYNVSATTAWVRWPALGGCRDTFYSVMYDHARQGGGARLGGRGLAAGGGWGYKRRSFGHEERVPAGLTAARLTRLLPGSAYLLCVTCQAADPAQDQCRGFSTLGDSPPGSGGGGGAGGGGGGGGWELAMAVWMASSLLLLLLSGVLLWGCLHNACPLFHHAPGHAHRHAPGYAPADGRPEASGLIYGTGGGAGGGEDEMTANRGTVLLNPLFGPRGGVGAHRGGLPQPPLRQQEGRGFTRLSGCRPV